MTAKTELLREKPVTVPPVLPYKAHWLAYTSQVYD